MGFYFSRGFQSLPEVLSLPKFFRFASHQGELRTNCEDSKQKPRRWRMKMKYTLITPNWTCYKKMRKSYMTAGLAKKKLALGLSMCFTRRAKRKTPPLKVFKAIHLQHLYCPSSLIQAPGREKKLIAQMAKRLKNDPPLLRSRPRILRYLRCFTANMGCLLFWHVLFHLWSISPTTQMVAFQGS